MCFAQVTVISVITTMCFAQVTVISVITTTTKSHMSYNNVFDWDIIMNRN